MPLHPSRLLSALVLTSAPLLHAQVASLDPNFNIGGGFNGEVHALRVQADQRILVGGTFTSFDGQTRNRLARLNANGSLDSTFDPGTGANSTVTTLATDGKNRILVGGSFGVFADVAVNGIVRLTSAGAVDPALPGGWALNGPVYNVLPLPNGDVLAGGAFTTAGALSRPYLAKLLENGGSDPSFLPAVNGPVYTLAQQEDGKLLVGGEFSSVGGLTRWRVARLLPSGAVDPSFDPASGPNSTPLALMPLPEGKLLVGGQFSADHGVAFAYLARLEADGLPDFSFPIHSVNSYVYALQADASGGVLVGGSFSSISGVPRPYVARLATDGSLDSRFVMDGGPNNAVRAIATQADGKILIGGSFTAVNGTTRGYLARLEGLASTPGGEIEFTAAQHDVTEGTAQVVLTVRRSGNKSSAVQVTFATQSDTANAGDYFTQTGTLTFGPNQDTQTITVRLRSDANIEDDERFAVNLSNPTGGAELGLRRQAVVVIHDDDSGSTVGSVKTSFNAGANGPVYALGLTPDGGTVLGGQFTAVEGRSRLYLAKNQADGSLDPTFTSHTWLDRQPRAIAVQTDGGILVGGDFTAVSGVPRAGIAKLQPNGLLDPTFSPGSGVAGSVYDIAPLEEGDLLIAGTFASYAGQPVGYLARLFGDGTLDDSFKGRADGVIYAVAVQADRKIVLGGEFQTVNGVRRTRIARLNADGSLDATFDPGRGPNSTIYDLQVNSGGEVFIGGAFTAVNDFPVSYLSRLTSRGIPAAGFAGPGLNGAVIALALFPGGSLAVGGSFTTVNGAPSGALTRVLPNGTPDPTFQMGDGVNGAVRALAVRDDGDLVLGGDFTKVGEFRRSYVAAVVGLSAATGGELEFSVDRYQAVEGSPTVQLTVRRTGNRSQPVTVDYATANGTAKAGDYTQAAGTLSFAANETTRTLTLSIRDDSVVEEEESFQVTLSNPTNGAELGGQRTAEVVILDNDSSTVVGSVDASFSSHPKGPVYSLALYPDGRLLAGGAFVSVNGQSRNRLARLTPEGALDDTFYSALWFDNYPAALALQEDGRIVVGGTFTTGSVNVQPYLTRLLDDGRPDPTFAPGGGPNGVVYDVLLLDNGEILAAGAFTQYSGQPAGYLVRVFSDGTREPTFAGSANGSVYALARQVDGKILLGGDFTAVNGTPRNRIARLNRDGSLDATFDPAQGFNSSVLDLALGLDGRIVVGGAFSLANGGPWPYLAQLTPSGLPVTTFRPNVVNSTVYTVAVGADGRILAGGGFTLAAGKTWNRLARLNDDGSPDLSFEPGTGFDNLVEELLVQPDGNLVVAGDFTTVDGVSRPYLTRLQGLSSSTGGEIEFAEANYMVSEAQPNVVLTLRRRGNTSAAVAVDYATTSITADPGDYAAVNKATVVFGVRDTTRTITIPIHGDTTVEDDETFTVTLSNPTGGAELGSRRSATITLVNDDESTQEGFPQGVYGGRSNGSVQAIAADSDGSAVIAGEFSIIQGEARLRVARLLADGTLDPAFAAGASLDAMALAALIQPDHRIVVAGRFTVANGTPRARLARYEADGTLDTSFDPRGGANSDITELALLPNHSLLIGGAFTTYAGQPATYLARVFEDGSLDTSFKVPLNGGVWGLALDPASGKILIAGDFTQVHGTPRNRVARLHPDGALDPSFDPGSGPNSTVLDLVIQADSSVVVGGAFTAVADVSKPYLARLGANGALDATFPSLNPNSQITTLGLARNGRIVVGGYFTAFGGEPRNRLARLLPEGGLDPSFENGVGANGIVHRVLPLNDGALLVGGDFTQMSGLNRAYFARLRGPAAAGGDLEFRTLRFEPTGGIRLTLHGQAGRRFALERSEDLKTWTKVSDHTFAGETQEVVDATPPANRATFYRANAQP